MRYVYLLAALLSLVPSFALAQAQQPIKFKDGQAAKDGSNNLIWEMDSATADGPELNFTPAGDIRVANCITIGSGSAVSAAAGSCICRDPATDRLYADKDCGQTTPGVPDKDAGEEFLDEATGGGGGGDNVFVNGTATASTSPNFLDNTKIHFDGTTAPPAITATMANGSVGATELATSGVTTVDIAAGNVTVGKLDMTGGACGDNECFTYDGATGKMDCDTCGAGVAFTTPATPPIVPDSTEESFQWVGQKQDIAKLFFIQKTIQTAELGAASMAQINYANYDDIFPTNCNADTVGASWLILDSVGNCSGGGGSAKELCTCAAVGALPQNSTAAALPTCNAAASGIHRIVYDAASSSSCAGGGTTDNECECNGSSWVDTPTPTVAYKGQLNGQSVNYWLESFSGADPGSYGELYTHNNLDWHDPWVRIGDSPAGGCNQLHWVWGNGSSTYYEARAGDSSIFTISGAMTDDSIASVSIPNRFDDTVAFWGWVNTDSTTIGNVFINPAGTTPATAIQGFENGYGMLFISPKFYLIFRRNNVTSSSVLADYTVAADRLIFASNKRGLMNLVLHISNHSAVLGEDSYKDAAYAVGFVEGLSTPMTAAPTLPTTGNVDLFDHPNLAPVVTACAKPGASFTSEAFFQLMAINYSR